MVHLHKMMQEKHCNKEVFRTEVGAPPSQESVLLSNSGPSTALTLRKGPVTEVIEKTRSLLLTCNLC